MSKKRLAVSLCLSAAMLIAANVGVTAAADEAAIKTPSQAVAEMTWGTNLCDLYMADVEYPQGSVHGYVDYGNAAVFGLAAWFGEDGFDWLTYHDMYNGTFEVSVAIPDYSSVSNWNNSLFELGVMTTSTDYTVGLTLSDCRLIKKDGSTVKLNSMNKTYTCPTAEGPDMNGWCRYVLSAPAEAPKPDSSLNGSKLCMTVTVQESNTGGMSKAEYFYQKDRYKMDREKLTDLFIEEGANVFRLPVTWTSFVNDTTFEIDKEWLDMVKEEVDYILSKGAYCILNMHNDYLMRSFVGVKENGEWTNLHWEKDWMLDEYSEYVNERFKAVWAQIAEYFKDYPQQLIFETANEPSTEWYEDISYDMNAVAVKRVNEMNKMFVDTVRASGGKNADRFLCLAVADYNTYHCLSDLVLPDDDGLMVQLHSYNEMEYNTNFQDYYTVNPSYDYVGQTDKLFDAVSQFQRQHPDVPVIIGENGISQKMKDADAAPRAEYFYTKAKEYGVPCLWWEDYFVTDEKIEYWLYDKAAQKWGRPTLLDIIKDKSGLADPILTEIKVNSTGHKTQYLINEPLDVSGLTIIADMSRGEDPIINVTKDMISGFDSSVPKAKQTLTITYQGKTTTYEIAISLPTVTGLSLKGRAADALRLSWTKNTSADGYIIERKDGSQWVRVAKITNNTTTEYRIDKLKAGTAYNFRIRAYKMDGKTALYSGYASISARTNPSAVTGLKLKGRAADALRLAWTKNTSADGYIIERKDGSQWVRVAKITKNTTTEYRIDKLKAGTAYTFRIKAYKMDGKTALYSGYTSISARTNPSAVTGLKLKGRAADALRLAWTKNTSADGYIIERKDGSQWVRVAKITNNSTVEFKKSGLKAGTAYTFRVKAYKMSGKTALYGTAKTISVCTNPSTVSGLKLKASAKDAIRLAWSKNTSADGYIIEMKSGSTWTRVGKISKNSTVEFKKSGLKSKTSYSFRVKAYKMSGKTALYGATRAITVKTK